MLPISSKDILTFTPEHYDGTLDAPVFHIAVPTLRTRAAIRRAMTAEGVAYLQDDAMFELLRDGARQCLVDEHISHAIEIIDTYEALIQKLGASKDEARADASLPQSDLDVMLEMKTLEDELKRIYPPYAAAIADRGYYLELLPIMNFKHCVVGWSGLESPYAARIGMVDDAALAQVPPRDLIAVGWHIQKLTVPSKELEKN